MIPSKGENTKQFEFWVTAQHGKHVTTRWQGTRHSGWRQVLDRARCGLASPGDTVTGRFPSWSYNQI
jgi:hypothetical protein